MLLLDELRDSWRSEPTDHRVALVALFVIAVALRVPYLDQPMRYDESVTYMLFGRLPWSEVVSNYVYPNNHIFHTLLVKGAATMFGSSPPVLRTPAFLAGLLVVPATYVVTRALYSAPAALLAMALVASSGVLTLYSTNARGYSLVVLAFLLLVLIGVRLLRGGAPSLWITFAIVAAVGLWTIPVMLFPLGAVGLWLALTFLVEDRSTDLRRLIIAMGVTAGLTLLAYAPVISRGGLAAITGNRFVASQGYFEFFDRLPSTIRDAVVSWGLGLPAVVSLLLAACALLALSRHAKLSTFRVGVPLAAFVWSAWLLVLNHRAPFPRVWLWLLPVAAALAGAGAIAWLEARRRTAALIRERAPAIAVGLAVAASLSVALSKAVLSSRDTGTYPDAAQAAEVLRRAIRPDDRVLAGIPLNAPLLYYFDKVGVAVGALSRDEASAARVFVVVDEAEGQSLARATAQSAVRDTIQFGPPGVLSTLPSSMILVFQRRNAAKP